MWMACRALRMPLRVSTEGVNTYALSGHKLHGPKGISALVLAPGVHICPSPLAAGKRKQSAPRHAQYARH